MSTRAVAAAAPAATPEATAETAAKKTRTVAALDAEARALFQRRTSAVAAAKWAHENKVGSRKACSTGKFGNVTYNMVEPLLRELEQYGSISEDRDHAKQILTNDERRKLAEWILACGDGHNPKDRTQISAKVRQILKARHASNKKKRWRAGSVRLNEQEVSAAQSREPRLSTHFFQRFYPWCRAHGIKIEEGTARAQDQKRAAKMTEATVQRHFFGKYGLEAELIDAGIMDPETKVIKDPRRLLNSDETPQPIDAPQKGRRPKVAKRQGQSVRKSTTVNKEQVSVNMTWDLSGHMYGCSSCSTARPSPTIWSRNLRMAHGSLTTRPISPPCSRATARTRAPPTVCRRRSPSSSTSTSWTQRSRHGATRRWRQAARQSSGPWSTASTTTRRATARRC